MRCGRMSFSRIIRNSRTRDDLPKIPIERYSGVSPQEVTEAYEYSEEGIIRVEIENKTSGYKKLFTLGPKSAV